MVLLEVNGAEGGERGEERVREWAGEAVEAEGEGAELGQVLESVCWDLAREGGAREVEFGDPRGGGGGADDAEEGAGGRGGDVPEEGAAADGGTEGEEGVEVAGEVGFDGGEEEREDNGGEEKWVGLHFWGAEEWW